MAILTIDVTAEDIYRGEKATCEFCPVALGTQRATGDQDAYVTTERIIIFGKSYSAPDAVVDFIDNFDGGGAVAPFSFDLEVDLD